MSIRHYFHSLLPVNMECLALFTVAIDTPKQTIYYLQSFDSSGL